MSCLTKRQRLKRLAQRVEAAGPTPALDQLASTPVVKASLAPLGVLLVAGVLRKGSALAGETAQASTAKPTRKTRANPEPYLPAEFSFSFGDASRGSHGNGGSFFGGARGSRARWNSIHACRRYCGDGPGSDLAGAARAGLRGSGSFTTLKR